MCYLFVYGTLQPGFKNPDAQFLLGNAEIVSEGYIYGTLYDVGDYPGVTIDDGQSHKVLGTIFSLKNRLVLSKLDQYEEVGRDFALPNEYERVKMNVNSYNLKKYDCWIYVYKHSVENLERIDSGNYLEYLKFK